MVLEIHSRSNADDECYDMGPMDALMILISSIILPTADVYTDLQLAYSLLQPRCYKFPTKDKRLLMTYILLKNQFITSKSIIFQHHYQQQQNELVCFFPDSTCTSTYSNYSTKSNYTCNIPTVETKCMNSSQICNGYRYLCNEKLQCDGMKDLNQFCSNIL